MEYISTSSSLFNSRVQRSISTVTSGSSFTLVIGKIRKILIKMLIKIFMGC